LSNLSVSDTLPCVINIEVTIGLIEYDVNNLNLNLFSSKIIHKDITELKKMHCFNIYYSHQFNGRKIKSISDIVAKLEEKRWEAVEVNLGGDGRGDGYGIGDDVFGLRG
jgi:hypothetical protein